MNAWTALTDHLARNHGVGRIDDGVPFGLSPAAVRRRWARREWPMPLPGVIVLPGTELDTYHRLLATVRWFGGDIAVTSTSALWLHDATTVEPRRLQLVVPTRRRSRRGYHWGQIHRSDLPFERGLVTARGIPAVDVAWALRDRAHYGGPGDLTRLAISALQRRRTTLDSIAEVAAANPTAGGMPDLLAACERLRRDRADSGLELDSRDFLRQHGFDPYPRPFPVRCTDGRVIHLDIPFPPYWFAIECEDVVTHGSERSFYTDRTRWNKAMQAGWRVGFVWRERLERDPQGIVAEVRDALRTADPNRPPPEPAHECGDRCP